MIPQVNAIANANPYPYPYPIRFPFPSRSVAQNAVEIAQLVSSSPFPFTDSQASFSAYSTGSFPLPTRIFNNNLSPRVSTLTIPLPPFPPFNTALGSKLCLLLGLSLSSPSNLRFLLPCTPLSNLANSSGLSLSFTILLRLLFCFGGAGAAAGALMTGTGTGMGVGRGDGAADGRGDGAADDGRDEDAAVGGPSLVLILSLGVGSGIGDWMTTGGFSAATGKGTGV
jgi:hypothetical protein